MVIRKALDGRGSGCSLGYDQDVMTSIGVLNCLRTNWAESVSSRV